VLQIDYEEASRIVAIGLSVPHSEGGAESRVGLSDLSDLTDVTARPIEQVLQSRRVRDASFHYRVVEKAYQGRCAFTGVRMTNGHGRAEADAAHIRPVAADGPDTVRNGLALMKSLHWAFDRGLVALADDGRILTVERGLEEPVRHLLAADGRAILPRHADERPHPAFLRWHREHVFKGAA
jgi:putative restriction endonuclease